jgi:hypothetical protein
VEEFRFCDFFPALKNEIDYLKLLDNSSIAQKYLNTCTKCSISFETSKKPLVTSDLNSCTKNVVDRLWQRKKPVEAKVLNITVKRSIRAQIIFLCAVNDFVFRCGED